MLAGPAGKRENCNFATALGLYFLTCGERRETTRMGENQLDRLQQEQDAGSNLERRHADLQELQKLRTANCEDDENSAGYRRLGSRAGV
jgi:hypothetical protein